MKWIWLSWYKTSQLPCVLSSSVRTDTQSIPCSCSSVYSVYGKLSHLSVMHHTVQREQFSRSPPVAHSVTAPSLKRESKGEIQKMRVISGAVLARSSYLRKDIMKIASIDSHVMVAIIRNTAKFLSVRSIRFLTCSAQVGTIQCCCVLLFNFRWRDSIVKIFFIGMVVSSFLTTFIYLKFLKVVFRIIVLYDHQILALYFTICKTKPI